MSIQFEFSNKLWKRRNGQKDTLSEYAQLRNVQQHSAIRQGWPISKSKFSQQIAVLKAVRMIQCEIEVPRVWYCNYRDMWENADNLFSGISTQK